MCLQGHRPLLSPLAEVLDRHFSLSSRVSRGMALVPVSHLTGGLQEHRNVPGLPAVYMIAMAA